MKIALTGGGTLGHVIPCLSVMDTLKEIDPNINFFYIGSEKENEKALVTDRGIKYYSVKTGKLRRYFSLKNFVDCFLWKNRSYGIMDDDIVIRINLIL